VDALNPGAMAPSKSTLAFQDEPITHSEAKKAIGRHLALPHEGLAHWSG
jgi:hypothetical protein